MNQEVMLEGEPGWLRKFPGVWESVRELEQAIQELTQLGSPRQTFPGAMLTALREHVLQRSNSLW